MKKLMALLLVLVVSLVLAACGDKTPEPTPTPDDVTETPTPTPGEPTKTPVKEVKYASNLKKGVPVVTFCSWSVGTEEEFNLTRRLVGKFNYEHDDVQIQLIEPDLSMDYEEFLSTLASAKKLPDIFMTRNLPRSVIQGLAKDLTTLTSEDDEWEYIDPVLANEATYEGHVYGIPTGQYYMGFFANYELLDKYTGEVYADEAFAPGKFSLDTFISTVKSMRKINVADASGVVGLNATGDMVNWLPGTLDTTGNIKHFVWNAEAQKFDFRSQAMYDALAIIADLGSKTAQNTFASVPDDKKEAVFGTGSDVEAFKAGKIGFLQGGTWDNYEDARGFDVHFVGYPGGRVISAADYTCISDAAKNPKLAYEVAKYLTYGLEGAQSRFEIIDYERYLDPKTPLSVAGLPVVSNKEVTDRWFEYVSLDGAKEVYEKVVSGEMTLIVEGNKTIPGFEEARFQGQTGLAYKELRNGAPYKIGDFIWDVCSGDIKLDTYMSDISEALADKLNENVTKAYADIKKIISESE